MKVLRCPKLAVNPYANMEIRAMLCIIPITLSENLLIFQSYWASQQVLGTYLNIAKLKKSWKFVYILAKITLQFHDFLDKIISSRIFFKKFPSKTCWDIQ